jgi:hypothetical protein
MTRNQLYDCIYHISDALNTLQVIGEETMEYDEDDEFPEEINLQIGDTLLQLEEDIY